MGNGLSLQLHKPKQPSECAGTYRYTVWHTGGIKLEVSGSGQKEENYRLSFMSIYQTDGKNTSYCFQDVVIQSLWWCNITLGEITFWFSDIHQWLNKGKNIWFMCQDETKCNWRCQAEALFKMFYINVEEELKLLSPVLTSLWNGIW